MTVSDRCVCAARRSEQVATVAETQWSGNPLGEKHKQQQSWFGLVAFQRTWRPLLGVQGIDSLLIPSHRGTCRFFSASALLEWFKIYCWGCLWGSKFLIVPELSSFQTLSVVRPLSCAAVSQSCRLFQCRRSQSAQSHISCFASDATEAVSHLSSGPKPDVLGRDLLYTSLRCAININLCNACRRRPISLTAVFWHV